MPSFKSYWSSLAYHTVTRPSITLVRHGADKLKEIYRRRRMVKRGHNPNLRKKIVQKTRGSLANKPSLWDKNKGSLAVIKRRQSAAKQAWSLPRPKRSRTGDLSKVSGIAGTKASNNRNKSIRQSVLKKTRGKLSTNPRLWRADTITGANRRKEAAARAWAAHRPRRSRSGDLSKVSGIPKPKPSPKPTAAQKALVRKTSVGSVQAAVHSSTNYGTLRRKLTGQAVRKTVRSISGTSGKFDRKQHAATIRALRKDKLGNAMLKHRIKAEKASRMTSAAKKLATIYKKP